MRLPEGLMKRVPKDDPLIRGFDRYGDLLLLYSDKADLLLDRLKSDGIESDYAVVRRSTLEDVFLKLTGRRLTE
jgi:lipooligosaccharide transport system ATP-binding protein